MPADIDGYLNGLKRLRSLVEQHNSSSLQGHFDTLEGRLKANIDEETLYGSEERSRSERHRILASLNQFTRTHFTQSFNDLCEDDLFNSSYTSGNSPSFTTYENSPSRTPWQGGDEFRGSNDEHYLIHDAVETIWSSDRAVLQQRAKALLVTNNNRPVWLKQLRTFRSDSRYATLWNENLLKEARLLEKLEQEEASFPRVISFHKLTSEKTLVTIARKTKTLQDVFGNGSKPLEAQHISFFLRSLPSLCSMLKALHIQKYSHRNLSLSTIFLLNNEKAILEDVGLATVRPVPHETDSAYQAPEQERLLPGALPGPATDVYQLGAIIYHLLTGQRPSITLPSTGLIEPTRWNTAIPIRLNSLLLNALNSHPKERPTIERLARDIQSVVRQR